MDSAGIPSRWVFWIVSDNEIGSPSGSRKIASLIPSPSRALGGITKRTPFDCSSRNDFSISGTVKTDGTASRYHLARIHACPSRFSARVECQRGPTRLKFCPFSCLVFEWESESVLVESDRFRHIGDRDHYIVNLIKQSLPNLRHFQALSILKTVLQDRSRILGATGDYSSSVEPLLACSTLARSLTKSP